MQQLSFLPGEMTPGERSLILRALKTLEQNYRHYRTILNRFSVGILSCQTHSPGQHFPTTITPPWWGLPCTVTPCFGARLVQEGKQLH